MKIIVIIFVLFFTYSNACRCVVVDTSKPGFLCKADYVLRGEVDSETLIGNVSLPMTRYRMYTVKVQQIYKGLNKISNITNGNTSYIKIKTPEQSAACGVTFPLHKDLAISGSLGETEVRNFRCSGWHKEAKSLSQEFNNFLTDIEQHCSSASTTIKPATSFVPTVGNKSNKNGLFASLAFVFAVLLHLIIEH